MTVETRRKVLNPKIFLNFKLTNGLNLEIIQKSKSPFVHVLTFLKGGSSRDPVNRWGTAHFLEHLYFKAIVHQKTVDEIALELKGKSTGFTAMDYTLFYTILPQENLLKWIEIEKERLEDFSFNYPNFFAERKSILKELKDDSNNPFKILRNLFLKEFIDGGHPYKFPVMGDRKSVLIIEERDILLYHKNFYTPENMKIVISGNISEKIIKKIIHILESIPGRTKDIGEIEEIKFRNGFFEEKVKFIENPHLLLGIPVPPFQEEDFVHFLFLKVLLKSRLERNLKNLTVDLTPIMEETSKGFFLLFHLIIKNWSYTPGIIDTIISTTENLKIDSKSFNYLKEKLLKSYQIYMEENFHEAFLRGIHNLFERENELINSIKRLKFETFKMKFSKMISPSKIALGVLNGKD